MAEVWVANASPVIVLAKVGRLDLLKKLSDELLLAYAWILKSCVPPWNMLATYGIRDN